MVVSFIRRWTAIVTVLAVTVSVLSFSVGAFAIEENADSAVMTVTASVEKEEADVAEVSNTANTVVEELLSTLENKTTDEAVSDVETTEKDINQKIQVLQNKLMNAGNAKKLQETIERQIIRLKELRVKLRAKAMIKVQEVKANLVRKVVAAPRLYEIRWGELDEALRRCQAQDATGLETKCTPESVEYEGKISVDSGTLAVRKELLFEEATDKVTQEKGSAIAFQSTIAGHWDGLLVEYAPDASGTSDSAVNVTVVIGDLQVAKTGFDIFGRYEIGNGHEIEIRRGAQVLTGVAPALQTKIIDNQVAIKEKLANIYEKARVIRSEVDVTDAVTIQADALEAVADEVGENNFEDESAAEIEAEIQAVASTLAADASSEEIQAKVAALKKKLEEIKVKNRVRKFEKNMIPFKDTDDTEWYTAYVNQVKNKGVISGYKDAAGNEMGEFRPANNITVAEILKIALETADKGQDTSSDPNLAAAQNHWAKGYVKEAEELGASLVQGDVDINRPATRGEVVRLMLEALGVEPEAVENTDFSDLSASDPNTPYIEYAKNLDIVSGDAGKTTFRPNDPVNRAEAAKIANQVMEILMGGQ
ncbi:S-layer homology domain-containing protein [Candidatus Peregrinibacteria bacterium]|nr:S-layer homology domain-containing protein [Candidatus Peregrinibacteria bacterium]